MADNWDSNEKPWDAGSFNYQEARPVYCTSSGFFVADSLFQTDAVSLVTARIERVGIPLIQGKVSPSSLKQVTRVWPVFVGSPGDAVNIYLGTQDESPDESIFWEGPFPFLFGQTEYVDPWLTGRFMSYRIEADQIRPWTLLSLTVDFDVVGEN